MMNLATDRVVLCNGPRLVPHPGSSFPHPRSSSLGCLRNPPTRACSWSEQCRPARSPRHSPKRAMQAPTPTSRRAEGREGTSNRRKRAVSHKINAGFCAFACVLVHVWTRGAHPWQRGRLNAHTKAVFGVPRRLTAQIKSVVSGKHDLPRSKPPRFAPSLPPPPSS